MRPPAERDRRAVQAAAWRELWRVLLRPPQPIREHGEAPAMDQIAGADDDHPELAARGGSTA